MNRFIHARLTAVAILTLCAAPALADRAGFSGAWESEAWSTEGWPLEPPFTPAGRAAQQAWASAPEQDPAHLCIIPLGRIISAPMPVELIVEDQRVVMLYEYEHQIRRVRIDAEHPDDWYPTLMGHSVGRWDGDVLIVETAGMEPGYFRPQGLPYTGDLRLTERYELTDGGQRMLSEWTIDDPEFYAEPWTVKKSFARLDGDIKDYDCIVRPHIGVEND